MQKEKTNPESQEGDSMVAELYESGRLSYRQMQEGHNPRNIHFDEGDGNRFWISADYAKRILQLPSEVALQFQGLTRTHIPSAIPAVSYDPAQRVAAYLKGFGNEAVAQKDFATALEVLKTLERSFALKTPEFEKQLSASLKEILSI